MRCLYKQEKGYVIHFAACVPRFIIFDVYYNKSIQLFIKALE